MSFLPYVTTKDYIVTVHNKEDLESIYEELETLGKAPPNTELTRKIHCVERRPISRNTVYKLIDWEVDQLRRDPRIKSVTPSPKYLGIKPGTNAITQVSNNWNKSTSTNANMLNWGLLRCFEGAQITGWGSNGTTNASGAITLTQTGKNVDVVIVDGDGIIFDHPEYAVNSDGTGGSRAIAYNWFQHQTEVGGIGGNTYVYGLSDHATHVAGTVAGNTQGWARDANIYNIYYDAGGQGSFAYAFDYVREFHRTKSVNPATGRKNPTICNNSWGWSIFPSEWSFQDITAVTYRGTRYIAPGGTVTSAGESGIYGTTFRIAEFNGTLLENVKQRVINSGTYDPADGDVTLPPSWFANFSGTGGYIDINQEPAAEYVCTVNGPANITIYHGIAISSNTGPCTLTGSIEIYDSSNTLVTSFTDGPYTDTLVQTFISQLYFLENNEIYTVKFKTTVDLSLSDEELFFGYLSIDAYATTDAAATVTDLTFESISSIDGLFSSTTPTVGNNDDGYWTVPIPFPINYLGTVYNEIFVGTNFYFTFGTGSTAYANIGNVTPPLPRIMISADDNSMQRIYYGTVGVAPSREFRIVVEGNASTYGTLGSPGMRMELKFYEAFPRMVDVTIEQNNKKMIVGGGFTTAQLNSWGFIAGQRIPQRIDAIDVDLEDAFQEGIIMTGAAGNGRWKHDLPGGPDWDNTFEMAYAWPESVNFPYYYMRGTSPTANDTVSSPSGTRELPNICVGAVDITTTDRKVNFSDCGPGVDIYAPGTAIISSLPDGVADNRNTAYYIGKFSGTSMASPQVCGVLACALEIYPHWNQYQAKEYISKIAKPSQLLISNGGPTDTSDLQGSPNLYLFYRQERVINGNTYPKINYNFRPSTGAVYPRPRIRRSR